MDDPSSSDVDAADLRILRLLQGDGRLSNAELAKRAALSPASCHRRTRRLFEKGHIRAVRAEVEPRTVSLKMVALVGITLDRSTPATFADFEAAVARLPTVLECSLVAGDFDYLLKVRVKDVEAFNKIHGDQLIALPHVRQARTFFVLKEVKHGTPLVF